jgi:hypothetical protein
MGMCLACIALEEPASDVYPHASLKFKRAAPRRRFSIVIREIEYYECVECHTKWACDCDLPSSRRTWKQSVPKKKAVVRDSGTLGAAVR